MILAAGCSSTCAMLWLRGMSGVLTRMLEISFSWLDLELIKCVIDSTGFTSDADSELLSGKSPTQSAE